MRKSSTLSTTLYLFIIQISDGFRRMDLTLHVHLNILECELRLERRPVKCEYELGLAHHVIHPIRNREMLHGDKMLQKYHVTYT